MGILIPCRLPAWQGDLKRGPQKRWAPCPAQTSPAAAVTTPPAPSVSPSPPPSRANFVLRPPGPEDRAAGWQAPAGTGASPGPASRPAAGPAPSQAPPRRRRFEVPIRQIESINYEGNNLAAPRGAAAERSRGIRPQIALSLPK